MPLTNKKRSSSVTSASNNHDIQMFSNNVHHATPLVNDNLDEFWLDPGDARIETGLQGGSQYGWDLLGSAFLDYKHDRPIIYLGQGNKKDQIPAAAEILNNDLDPDCNVEYVEGDFVDHQYGEYHYFTPATKHDYKKHSDEIAHFSKPTLDNLSEQFVMLKLTWKDKLNQPSYIASELTLKGWNRGICQNLPVQSNSEVVFTPAYDKTAEELTIILSDKQGQEVGQFTTNADTKRYVFQIPDHLNMVQVKVQPASANITSPNAGFEGLAVKTGSFVNIETSSNMPTVDVGKTYQGQIVLTNAGYTPTKSGVLSFQTSEAIMNDIQISGFNYTHQGNNYQIIIPPIKPQGSVVVEIQDERILKTMKNEYVIGNIQFEYETDGLVINKKEIKQLSRGNDFSFKVNTPVKTLIFTDAQLHQQLGMTEVDASESIDAAQLPIPEGYQLTLDTQKLQDILSKEQDSYEIPLDHKQIPVPQKRVVTREIIVHYPHDDPQRIVQSATFQRVNFQDAITHEIKSGEWTGDAVLPAIDLKEIEGYQPNQTIPELTVNYQDGDSHIEVYFNKIADKQPVSSADTTSDSTIADHNNEFLKELQAVNQQQDKTVVISYKNSDGNLQNIRLPKTKDYNEIKTFLTQQFTQNKISMDDALTIFSLWQQKYNIE